jgi:DNA modification methylase
LRSRNVEGVQSFHKEIEETNLHTGIDLSILDEYVRVLNKINIYIWCNREQILDYVEYFVKKKKCNWEILVWAKQDPIPFCGTHYLVDKEYCLYFWETGANIHIPFDRGRTVFFSKKNIEDKKDFGHPTIKPLEIIKTLIENSSKKGDVVLDTFLGSGTTCVAAKELNRQYIGFELNPHFYKIALERLNGIDQNGQMSLLETDFEQLDLFEEE